MPQLAQHGKYLARIRVFCACRDIDRLSRILKGQCSSRSCTVVFKVAYFEFYWKMSKVAHTKLTHISIDICQFMHSYLLHIILGDSKSYTWPRLKYVPRICKHCCNKWPYFHFPLWSLKMCSI